MGLDTRLLVAVQRRTGHPATLLAARGLSLAGEHAGAWLAVAGAGALLDRRRRPEWVRAGGAIFTAHAASVVVKRVARRVRPLHEDVLTHVVAPSRWSFPSSHASSTTAAAVVLSPLLGRPVLLLAPAMAWSRLLLGVHYPSDVLSGMALGTAVALGTRRLAAAATPEHVETER